MTEMAEYLKRRSKRSKATEEIMQLNFSEKKKLYRVPQSEYCSGVESPASCCCNNYHSTDVRRQLRSSDLEDVDDSIGFNSREETGSIELCGDSKRVMLMASSSASTEKPTVQAAASPRRKSSAAAAKTPSEEELEEFFVEAEEYVEKRFAEKYNYDIVKDAPILGGRYEWVRTHALM